MQRPDRVTEVEPAGLVVVVLAVVARAAVQQHPDQVDPLVEQPGPVAEGGDLAGIGQVSISSADADGQDRAAA